MRPSRAQSLAALERADRVRLSSVARRRELAALPRPEGLRELAELIEGTTHEGLMATRLLLLLCAPRRQGRKTAVRACRRLGLNPAARLRDLTERQRRLLAASVRRGRRL